MACWLPKPEYTGSCGSRHSIRPQGGTRHLLLYLFIRKLTRTSKSKSTIKTCASIPIGPQAPADNISTLPIRQFVLLTYLPESSYPVKTNVHNIKIEQLPCRCCAHVFMNSSWNDGEPKPPSSKPTKPTFHLGPRSGVMCWRPISS